MNIPTALRLIQGRLIVSCQAWDDDPFHGSGNMALFARAAVEGGAAAIRANSPEDVRAIRQAGVTVPILAIQKRPMPDGRLLITPTFEDARLLMDAGATAIALDCTARGRSYGAIDRLRAIRESLGAPVAADIATVEEAVAAAGAGADFVLSTLRGYTDDTVQFREFDSPFIAELARATPVPVIAEGRIQTPEQARAAIAAGAFAVVVGSAITRPRDITARFAAALQTPARNAAIVAIDLGGSAIKAGFVVASTGELVAEEPVRTEKSSRDALLAQLRDVAAAAAQGARARGLSPTAAGVATAGWVDAKSGTIVYGTANLPDWSGAPVGPAVADATGLRTFVENDALAFAQAEKRFGAARDLDNFLCITLGTGIGGGAYVNGRLARGAASMAGAFGHLVVSPNGAQCTCGQRGCLEAHAGAGAMLRYARPARYRTARVLIATANGGESRARAAIRSAARFLAQGCAGAIHLLDPKAIILSGGVAQDNPILIDELTRELAQRVIAWDQRGVSVSVSRLGYHAGVLGAAAVALERMF